MWRFGSEFFTSGRVGRDRRQRYLAVDDVLQRYRAKNIVEEIGHGVPEVVARASRLFPPRRAFPGAVGTAVTEYPGVSGRTEQIQKRHAFWFNIQDVPARDAAKWHDDAVIEKRFQEPADIGVAEADLLCKGVYGLRFPRCVFREVQEGLDEDFCLLGKTELLTNLFH